MAQSIPTRRCLFIGQRPLHYRIFPPLADIGDWIGPYACAAAARGWALDFTESENKAMGDWIPDAMQKKLDVFQNFTDALAQRPEAYGVSAADAAESVRLVEQLKTAITVADNVATRTALTLAAKRECFAAAEKLIRRLGAFIRHNPNLGAAELAALGLPPKPDKRIIPPPTTIPLLSIRGIIPGGHEIEFADSTTPTRRGLAADTRGLELFVAYSPNNGGGAGGAGLGLDAILKSGAPQSILTRGLSRVIHPNERLGSVANYVGRWINARGEAGPFSQPVRMVLAMPADSRRSEAA